MSGSLKVNVELIDRYRTRLVLGWTELAEKAGLSGKICTKIRAGRPVAPRTVRKLAAALDVEPSRLVVVPSARASKPARLAACA